MTNKEAEIILREKIIEVLENGPMSYNDIAKGLYKIFGNYRGPGDFTMSWVMTINDMVSKNILEQDGSFYKLKTLDTFTCFIVE